MSLLVIIPCFNEALSIQQTIASIREVQPDGKIIVVDNASTDDTAARARECGVTVTSEPRPGKGYAFRKGITFLTPNTSSVLMVDGDATYGMETLTSALDLVSKHNYDMVIGTRTVSNQEVVGRSDQFRMGHVFGNRLLSWIFGTFFNLKITDTLSGYRVFSPAFLYSFHGGNSGFELETELNAHIKSIGALTTEIPVSYHGRIEGSESKLSTYRDGWKILRKNIQLVKNERPLFAFGALAMPWLFVSVVLLALVLKDFLETGLVPRFPSLIAAVGAFAISSQLWVTGMILERVKLNRNTILQSKYRSWILLQK
jgi:glycosyltransferase involved in cell wall biosynthesis